jgi:uncharacterized protein (DUF433 family)
MRWQDYIEQDPQVMLGKPVVKGTRITVEHILEELGHGLSEEELLRGHPRLTPEAIRAALLCGAASVRLDLLLSDA